MIIVGFWILDFGLWIEVRLGDRLQRIQNLKSKITCLRLITGSYTPRRLLSVPCNSAKAQPQAQTKVYATSRVIMVELFRNPKIDWLNAKKFFIGITIFLLLLGAAAVQIPQARRPG